MIRKIIRKFLNWATREEFPVKASVFVTGEGGKQIEFKGMVEEFEGEGPREEGICLGNFDHLNKEGTVLLMPHRDKVE